ncbi:IS1 family transposase [Flavobacterium amniphilum]|uniref:IS1 family transposase n=1 Tax=Flavobacterium amniphilum TaxID=1834035 RepID=UPI00202A5BB8|nr:IS1 family transposase [Flavobacterium amniphilum]MCL9807705.1 IS1 family transposase [Flavobacterium amniphilum]
MEKILCPKCSGATVKNGFQSAIQRYKCKLCKHKFQVIYKYRAYIKTINESIVVLLKEGCGIRSTSRVLNISKNTVLARIISIGNNLKPKLLLEKEWSYEMDEMWTFIGNKKNVLWITYAIERNSRSIVGFVVGSKTKENIQPLVNRLILNPIARICNPCQIARICNPCPQRE